MLLAEIDVAKKFRLKKNYRLSSEELAYFENTHRGCEEKQEYFCPLIYPITHIFGMRSAKNAYDDMFYCIFSFSRASIKFHKAPTLISGVLFSSSKQGANKQPDKPEFTGFMQHYKPYSS